MLGIILMILGALWRLFQVILVSVGSFWAQNGVPGTLWACRGSPDGFWTLVASISGIPGEPLDHPGLDIEGPGGSLGKPWTNRVAT